MTAERPGIRACFLVGPTAVGKSSVAQWIAEKEGCEIVSADSMTVYRGMDIGTAKPAPEERARAKYHCLDLTTPDKPFSVWDYRRAAYEALADVASRGARAIIAGGSGLYIKSLTDGLGSIPPSDPALREHWTDVLEKEGVGPLQEALRARNQALFESLADRQNPRRLIRALEQAEAGVNMPPRTWKDKRACAPLAGLVLPPDLLKSRIESRVREMYRLGLVEEVRALLQGGVALSPAARQAIGYAEAIDVLNGDCSPDGAIAKTVLRTKQFAKRQMTWFRHQANVKWIETGPETSIGEIAKLVLSHWEKYGPTEIAD